MDYKGYILFNKQCRKCPKSGYYSKYRSLCYKKEKSITTPDESVVSYFRLKWCSFSSRNLLSTFV